MKVNKSILFFCIVFLWAWTSLQAQTSYCKNLGFELGNFSNWAAYTWRYSTDVPSINTNPVLGLVNRRHMIMSDTTAYDANTGYALRKVPPGHLYSARLGDQIISSDGSPRCWEQSLRYTMTIDSNNALLIFKFALVLQFAITHVEINEPRFRLTLYDSNGNILPDCSNYDVYSSNKNIKGFSSFTPAGSSTPVMWRDWTSVGANLMKYIGTTITVEFMAADCTQHYHYGYAYFVAECHPLDIATKFCASDTTATLTAPQGFEKYLWTNSSGTTLDSVQTLYVQVPIEKASYNCTMTSATGCVVSLRTSIAKFIPKADFSSFMIDCKSNTVQFIDLSTKTNGTLSYDWNFWEGKTSYLESPPYTFKTSGMHKVTLILSNPPSTCKDTLTKMIESFSPPLVGITGDSTYCPGLKTYIKAYGAYDYTWNNGSKADSIEIGTPGGTFWLLGRSSTGCISDTIYKTLSEEPDWQFLRLGDTTICGTGSALLSASGAVSYLWNEGLTNDSIIVSTPGSYTVKGTNKRGCIKSLVFNVGGYPVPAVEFSLSPDALDSRHNALNGSIQAESGVQYTWDTGDGFSESGPVMKHDYNISNSLLQYMITLKAKSQHNCIDSSSKFIEVVPFIPNVFTPDGDGINDVFMSGFELEIVDRNGLQVFKGNNGWDGRHKGEYVDPDTYFFIIVYITGEHNIHTRKGYVTLVR
jgi:gliding motility-associated-like protein